MLVKLNLCSKQPSQKGHLNAIASITLPVFRGNEHYAMDHEEGNLTKIVALNQRDLK
jgi:hypothetical protein